MINALFIVWRECFEAVLIVGILYAYLRRQPNSTRSIRFMWGGITCGLILSGLLAWAFQHVESELQGNALEYFEISMLTVAALLMTQMCIWMHRHSKKLKGELEGSLADVLTTSKLIGVATIAAVAIAREGFELVMFFYGMGIEAANQNGMSTLIGYSLAGVALTAVTYWAYYRGLKIFNPKVFFRVTAVFLLVTASSLLVASTLKLLQMDAIPTLKSPIWDTSGLLDERSGMGQFISTMTGYHSTPALMTVLILMAYWLITLFFYFEVPKRLNK